MKYEIKIPKTIKVGGFDYKIELSEKTDKELESTQQYGASSQMLRNIKIWTRPTPQQLSETFLHEILHAVDSVYAHGSLSEEQNASISNGLFQVFEQLGVRFIK